MSEALVQSSMPPVSPGKRLDQLIERFASLGGPHCDESVLRSSLNEYASAILDHLSLARRDWNADPVGYLFLDIHSYQQRRFIAAALLRLLGTSSTVFQQSPFRHQAFKLFDSVYEQDLYKRLGFESRSQTHEKEMRLRDIAGEVEKAIDRIDQAFSDINSIAAFKAAICKTLKAPDVRIIAHPLMPNLDLEPALIEPMDAVIAYLKSDADQAVAAFRTANLLTQQLLERSEKVGTTYSVRLIARPMLKIRNALREHFTNSPFHAPPSLSISASPKKYPFTQLNVPLSLELDVRNAGPGLALDLRLTVVDVTDAICENKTLAVGTLGISVIRVVVPISVLRRTSEVYLELDLDWDTFDQGRDSQRSTVVFRAQETNIDWDSLQTDQPYDLEPVTTDADLVGRGETLNQLQALLVSKQVGSAIVYGQKRVGKTSIVRTLSTRVADLPLDATILYLEAGDYVRPDPVRTIEGLVRKLTQLVKRSDSLYAEVDEPSFDGSFAVFGDFLSDIADRTPKRKFLFVLDEFDELPVSLYTQNDIADAFFLSIRSISAKPNFGFIIVGSEKMKAISSFQGHELNKFRSMRIDYFSREQNWPEFVDLVRKPVSGTLEYADEALSTLFDYTAGNPYFTKLICKTLFKLMVNRRDGHITSSEVHAAARAELLNVGSNSFLHFWEDGIVERGEERRNVSSRRQKVLIAYTEVFRAKEEVSENAIIEASKGSNMSSEVVRLELEELVQRQVMLQSEATYKIKVRFFALWLREFGFAELMPRLGERIITAERQENDAAYVKDSEISVLTERWGFYRGTPIAIEDVRRWLRQFGTNSDQRLMYKALCNVRYFREIEIRRGMGTLHSLFTRELSLPVSGRVPRVHNAVVSYLDGPGKSGSQYARLYGEENKVFHERIVEPSRIEKLVAESASAEIKAVIFLDDYLGTGLSATDNINILSDVLAGVRKNRDVRFFLGVLAGNAAAAVGVEKAVLNNGTAISIRIVEPLTNSDQLFQAGPASFNDEEEASRARHLAETFGIRLEPQHPLGFNNSQSNVVFERSCPNNCPPVLWKTSKTWLPLFRRH